MGVPPGNRRVLVSVPERYVAGADTRGRQEGRPYPWSQQVIREISGLSHVVLEDCVCRLLGLSDLLPDCKLLNERSRNVIISSYRKFHFVKIIVRSLWNCGYSLETDFLIERYRWLTYVYNNYIDLSNLSILQYFHQFVNEICGDALPPMFWVNGNLQNSGTDISMTATGD